MNQFKHILCVINDFEDLERVFDIAINLRADNQAELTFAMVIEKPNFLLGLTAQFNTDELLERMVDAAQTKLKDALQHCMQSSSVKNKQQINSQVLTGTGFISIIQAVISEQYDFVIKSQSEEEWLPGIFASDDMHLLRKCPCPVLMVKKRSESSFKRVLATVDFQSENDNEKSNNAQLSLNNSVVEKAVMMALADSADLHIACVWDAYGEKILRDSAFIQMPEEEIDQYLVESKQKFQEKMTETVKEVETLVGPEGFKFLNCKTHLKKGVPGKEIPALVNELGVDLLVMGTVARTGLQGLIIGNTAETVLKQVQCSVLALKPKGFVSPIMPKN